ncbi:MAG: radical SAM protein [Candidatus Pacearchaeota archaeon]
MIFPNIVHIDITGKCNLNCIHCRGRGSKDLTFSEIKECILKLASSFGHNLKWIEISGGEPFLRKDIFKILRFIKRETGLKIIIVSNGWFISPKTVKKLENLGIERVQISLDGAREETHNRIRQNLLAYKKAIRAIKLLANSKIISIVRMVLNKYNLNEVEDLFRLSKQLKVSEIGIRSAVLAGNAKKNKLTLNVKKYLKILKELPYLEKKYNLPFYSGDPLALIMDPRSIRYILKRYLTLKCLAGCSIGTAYIYINSEGYVCPCPNLQDIKLGHALKSEIVNLWRNSEIFKKCRSRDFSGKCGICEYKWICGGCRAFARILDHDLYGSDLRCPHT